MSFVMRNYSRFVALDPTSHGFGFVVLEEPSSLVDWGHANVRPCTTDLCLSRIAEILAWYDPSAVILEDWRSKSSRRRKRVKELLTEVSKFAGRSSARVGYVSRRDVLDTFSTYGAFTKDEIARVIVSNFPELEPKLPPPRKIWMSEDERMSIFDATALLLTFCHDHSAVPSIEI